MKSNTIISFLFLSVLFVIACSSPPPQGVKLVGPSEFQRLLAESQDVQLVDVRTPQEFAIGRVPEAQNIDFYNDDFKTNIVKLDKEKPVFVYCHLGGRSGKTAALMAEQGFTYVVDMDGGFSAWADGGLPVEE